VDSLTVLLILALWSHGASMESRLGKGDDNVIVVFGGVGSILAIVVVIAVIGAINGWTDASGQRHVEEEYWTRQRDIARAMNKAAEDHTRAVGTGVFVDGSAVTAPDPVEAVRVLRRR
jgi:hypothetical protein